MGCVSSSFLEDDARNLAPVFGHHIVSLTSSTYGLLSALDPSTPRQIPPSPPPPPPPPPPHRPEPEVINSWELMAGLDPLTPLKPSTPAEPLRFPDPTTPPRRPPGGDQAVVLYTTTLRTVRKTFEDCNAVRAAFEGLGVGISERDLSMHLGFREELRRLVAGPVALPRVFVGGRYVGGADEVLRMHEEGALGAAVEGLPKGRDGSGVCDGCGGARFLPCFRCSGSRKLVVLAGDGRKGGGAERRRRPKGRLVRCQDCNENGLAFCPICS